MKPITENERLQQYTDDESTSFVESESETINDTAEYIEEYDFKHKTIEIMYTPSIHLSVVGILLIIASWFAWKIPIFKNIDTDQVTIHIGNILLVTGSFILVVILTGTILDRLTLWYLKRRKGDASVAFYLNELAYHLSALLFLIFLLVFVTYWLDHQLTDLEKQSKQIIILAIFATVIMAILKWMVKYVSMRFNYNMYINAIRKCILFDFFVTLISTPREEDETIETTSFIVQKSFLVDDPTLLSFGEKRLLIKEFQNLAKLTKTYTGNLPVVLGKIKERARSKAIKLSRKLRKYDKVQYFRDLKGLFSNESVFRFVISQLKLELNQPIESACIEQIIEKTYRNRYVIRKNLEQINAAIQRVYLGANLTVCGFTIMFLILNAVSEIGYFSGIVSALFGTHFISKIISDNVVQSIIFLFVIHPFDIGDRVLVRMDGCEYNLVVSELNVFSTYFYRFDGTALIIPNGILCNTPISNIRRSGHIMESHSIQVSAKTSQDKLERLRKMLIEFCKANSDSYTDYILVNYEKIEDSNKLFLKILMQHRNNFQNYERYLKNKSVFLCELNRCLDELKIRYRLPTQRLKMIEKQHSPV